MPSFTQSLEQALHQALTVASEHNHEFATLEHLLLALLEDRTRVMCSMRVMSALLSYAKRLWAISAQSLKTL